MQFVVLIYRDESKDADVDWERLDAEYAQYNQALAAAGILRGGAKLESSPATTTLTTREGERLVTEGPYAETHEHLGGFFVLECADREEALKWADLCPGVSHGVVELRGVLQS